MQDRIPPVFLILHFGNDALTHSATLGSNSVAFVIHSGMKDSFGSLSSKSGVINAPTRKAMTQPQNPLSYDVADGKALLPKGCTQCYHLITRLYAKQQLFCSIQLPILMPWQKLQSCV